MAQKKNKAPKQAKASSRKPITTTVSPDQYRQISARAKKDGVRMATVTRDLLTKWAGR